MCIFVRTSFISRNMLYKVSVKRAWRHNNGFQLDPGMSVEVQSTKSSSANLLAGGMQEVSDAFKYKYGIAIPSSLFGFATNYLDATKI